MSDYALIQDNQIVQVGSVPQVYNDGTRDWDTRGMSDAELAAIGWLPVITTPRPADTDTTTHDHSVELVAGKPTEVWTARPKTQLEIDQATAQANQATITTESYANVDKLIAAVEALNVITAMTNAEINANPAAVIKDLAREAKTIARQVNHGARTVSGRLDSTDTGPP